ncbi:MAG: beta-carotene ketolase [Enterovirga sp.]|jgi:beta-carotene ketolase (CrtW type)|nr:beta-carotene ketolase [Enterovirga sp.]
MTSAAGSPPGSQRVAGYAVQTAVGLCLAGLIVSAWIVTHVAGVFLFRFDRDSPALVALLLPLQCWLSVGLFIVAHDAMHGSLAPFRPRLNRAIGRVCLALYSGFSYDRLVAKHFDHHRHAGTDRDPDFHAGAPRGFWPWYLIFFRRYFGWREFAVLSGLLALYLGLLRVPVANALVFWALPAILSSLQLFYFGTYLPHRHEDEPFTDRHNARSSGFSWPVSLLTCFHFGYHHEHHDRPDVPWWRLPHRRARA